LVTVLLDWNSRFDNSFFTSCLELAESEEIVRAMRKPYFTDGMQTIYLGDCLEIIRYFNDNSFDLVITDPPYGINFRSNYRREKYDKIIGDDQFPVEVLNRLFKIAKCAVYIFCRWENLYKLPKPKSVLAWVKNNWSMGDLKHEHGRQWEAICFYPQEDHKFVTRIPDIIYGNRTGNILHPTEKPVSVISQLISANVSETILDPFM
jgi:site-specific DNA-methyltransferase (adenine-specific)